MTRDTLLDIARKFDNVQFVPIPTFMHFWFEGEEDSFQSKPSEVEQTKFIFPDFLDYLELQQSKGHTVYILENSEVVMYDPNNFEPILGIRIKSEYGNIKKKQKKEIKEELASTSNFDKYRYLLIA